MDTDEKIIIVDNPTDLPLAKLDDFVLFQGDLKKPLSDTALAALKASILSHHLFIGKAVAKFNGQLLTEDGHQTLKTLRSLREEGYTSCQVLHYSEKDGNMVEDGAEDYADIMIPYQIVVPRGKDDYTRRKDAAAKIAIINSQYAELNPNTTFFANLDFSAKDIQVLSEQMHFPEVMFGGFTELGLNFVTPDDSISGSSDNEQEEMYSRKIEAPIYEITGEKPKIHQLMNTEKSDRLIQHITSLHITEQEKTFLIRAAYRHDVFDYGKIAEYYAHSEKETQEQFEDSTLIIIDFKKAIEQGYSRLAENIEAQYLEDYPHEV